MGWLRKVLCWIGWHNYVPREWTELNNLHHACKYCGKYRFFFNRAREYKNGVQKGYIYIVPPECVNEYHGTCLITDEKCVAYQPSCTGFDRLPDEQRKPVKVEAGIICLPVLQKETEQ